MKVANFPTAHGGALTSVCSRYSEIRERLIAGVKQAMKNKDQLASTTLRSVLSEVYKLEKSSGSQASSSAVVGVLRKAVLLRTESATQFIKGERPDLAEKESREAEIISVFLPPLLSQRRSRPSPPRGYCRVPTGQQSEESPRTGVQVDSIPRWTNRTVDADVVKTRAAALLST
ncbi:GatB YqeY domain-containing protein [Melanogaster broomeanus]|nr:GatB YqeY domain-containing protein [Melanogaster broomeanus]